MRILYLHQYYHTPAEGGAVRSYHIAQGLAAAGHTVHVITTWQGSVKRVSQAGNLQITHLPIPYSNSMSKKERMLAFWAFIWQSYREARQWLPADRVFATSTPLTIGLVALLLKYIHGVRYVFEVRDNWPEAPIQLGFVKGRTYIWFLRTLERWIYNQADSVLTLSPTLASHVQAQAPQTPVHMVPNFADSTLLTTTTKNGQEYFHVVYAGSFGYANQVQRLLDVALVAHKARLRIQFTLAGDGAERAAAEAFVLEHNLIRTVFFMPMLSRYGVANLLASADAAYIGFRPEVVLQANSPNKFFDALSAGVPVLLGVSGWLEELVVDSGCGVSFSSYSSDIEALKALMQKDWQAMHQACLSLAPRFAKETLVQKVVDVVAAAA